MGYKLDNKFETPGYLCADDFVGKPAMYITLRYLKEAYVKFGAEFSILVTEIANRKKLNRRTVTEALDDLQNMRLIEILGKVKKGGVTLRFDADMYASLSEFYYALPQSSKEMFEVAFQANDWKKIESMGFYKKEGLYNNMCKFAHIIESDNMCKNAHIPNNKCTSAHINENMCKNAHNIMCKNAHNNFSNTENNMCKNAHKGFTSTTQDLWQDLCSRYDYSAVSNAAFNVFGDPINRKTYDLLAEGDLDTIERFPLLTANKSGLDAFKRLLALYINLNAQKETETPENVEDDVLAPLSTSTSHLPENSTTSVCLHKDFKYKPIFEPDDVKAFVYDVQCAIQSPQRLFIHLFFDTVWEYAKRDYNIVDESTEENFEMNLNLLQGIVLTDKEIKDIWRNCWDDLCGFVEQGVYEGLPLGFDNLPINFSDRFFVDWKRVKIDTTGEKGYVVSLSGSRDIEQDDVNRCDKPKNAEEKRRRMQENVLFVKRLKEGNHTLTEAEETILNFYNDWVVLDDDYMTSGFCYPDSDDHIYSSIPATDIRNWAVSQPLMFDELATLFNVQPFNLGNTLGSRLTLFSVRSVLRWNEMHKYVNTLAHEVVRAFD